ASMIRARLVVHLHPGPPLKSPIYTRRFSLSPSRGLVTKKPFCQICQKFEYLSRGLLARDPSRANNGKGTLVMSGIADKSRELRAFAPALILLAICALINYVDRGNLSIAAPLLKDELRISASQLGILLSAFFWTYTAMQFVSGWMVDSFDANRVIAAGFLLW